MLQISRALQRLTIILLCYMKICHYIVIYVDSYIRISDQIRDFTECIMNYFTHDTCVIFIPKVTQRINNYRSRQDFGEIRYYEASLKSFLPPPLFFPKKYNAKFTVIRVFLHYFFIGNLYWKKLPLFNCVTYVHVCVSLALQ